MSGRPACVNFSQHAWKKDVCVNCNRLRSAHTDLPKPAKRVSKAVSGKDAPVDGKETIKLQEAHVEGNVKADGKEKGVAGNKTGNSGSHYYHKYDVTQRSVSNKPEKPEKPDIVKKNKEKESAITAAFVHTFVPVEDFTMGREQKYKESVEESRKKMLQHQRVVAVAAAEQHVALPYTIVDVSTIPHDVDPNSLESKPQAPDNPPALPATVPRRSKMNSTQPGHNTAPTPARRQASSDDKEATPMPTILHDDEQHNKDKVMSPNAQRKVAILIPTAPFPVSHVYEDIDIDDNKSGTPPKRVSEEKDTASTVVVDSDKFNSSKEAIGKSLDFKKETLSGASSPGVTVREETASDQSEKQDKARKISSGSGSGGKGFLSRFFSKGSKSDDGQMHETKTDGKPTGKQAASVSNEVGYLKSKSVDSESKHGPDCETGSPNNRVRKSVERVDSTKGQSALQSELKDILNSAAARVLSDDYENASVAAEQNRSRESTPPANMKRSSQISDEKQSKKPEKSKKPDIAKKPGSPPCDKKLSVVIDKRSARDKPLISPPKPVERPTVPPPKSPVKTVTTRRSNSSVDETHRLSCDTGLKANSQPESPVSPGKLEISMPKLEQSTVNVEMITSVYDNTPCSPKEPRSPRAQTNKSSPEVVSRDKTYGASGVKIRPKSEFIKGRTVKRMSAAPPPPPADDAPASPPVSARPTSGSFDAAAGDVMTKSFDRSFTHSTLPVRLKERPKMPDALPPEKLARYRRQAKAESTPPGRSRTLTEGVAVEPSTARAFNPKDSTESEASGSGSRLQSRALPSPPSHRRDNVYEAIDADDDGYYDDIVELSKSISFDSSTMEGDDVDVGEEPGTVVGDLVTDVLSVTGNVMTTSAEYLEPISRSDSGSDGVLSVNTTLNKEKMPTPTPSPRTSTEEKTTTPPTPTNYIDVMKCNPDGKVKADNFATAFLEMDAIHTKTLQSIVTDVCWEPQVMHDRSQGRLKMTDFKMEDKKPVLSHSSCMFYKVSTTKLEEMNKCILMISQKKPPGVLSGCNNMNILKPVAVFSENAPMETDASSKAASNYSSATVGVFNFSNIASLQDYLSKKFRSSQPSVPQVKQNTIMYLLIQVLNGLTWMAENGITPRSLASSDVLVVTSNKTSDQRLLLNPFRTKETDKKLSGQEAAHRFYHDFVKLALSVINVEMIDRMDLAKGLRSAGYADHSVALSHALCLTDDKMMENLQENNLLVAAKQIMEVCLWGPSPDQGSAMLTGSDPLVACHVWLALQRCTILSSHAVQGCSAAASWENTAYLHFLSNCTPEALLRIVRMISS